MTVLHISSQRGLQLAEIQYEGDQHMVITGATTGVAYGTYSCKWCYITMAPSVWTCFRDSRALISVNNVGEVAMFLSYSCILFHVRSVK